MRKPGVEANACHLEPRQLRQENHCELKVSLEQILNSKLALAM